MSWSEFRPLMFWGQWLCVLTNREVLGCKEYVVFILMVYPCGYGHTFEENNNYPSAEMISNCLWGLSAAYPVLLAWTWQFMWVVCVSCCDGSCRQSYFCVSCRVVLDKKPCYKLVVGVERYWSQSHALVLGVKMPDWRFCLHVMLPHFISCSHMYSFPWMN